MRNAGMRPWKWLSALRKVGRALEKGSWSGAMSPFETMYLDIRTTESLTDVALNISAEEGAHFHSGLFTCCVHVGVVVHDLASQ